MKKAFVIPLKYLLVFSGITLFLTLAIYIYTWDLQIALNHPASWHAAVMLNAAGSAILPGSILALAILIFMIQRNPGNALFSFLALWVSFCACFFLSFTALKPEAMFIPAGDRGVQIAGRIHSYTGGSVYIEESFTPGKPAVMLSPAETPRLTGGFLNNSGPDSAGIGNRIIERSPVNPFFSTALNPGTAILSIIHDSKAVSSLFIFLFSSSWTAFLFNLSAFGFLFCSLWIFGRFSSWPLLNVIYLLAIMRITLLLNAMLISPDAQGLIGSFMPGVKVTEHLPVLFYSAGAVLILWDIFFVPYDRYNRKDKAGRKKR